MKKSEVKPKIAKAKMKFITADTEYSQLQIAEMFDISVVTVNSYSQKENWPELREQHWQSVEKKTLQKISEQTAKRMSNINDQHIDTWQLMHDKLKVMLLTTAKPVELNHLANIMEKIQKGQRLALGLDKQENVAQEQLLDALEKFNNSVQAPKDYVKSLFEDEANGN